MATQKSPSSNRLWDWLVRGPFGIGKATRHALLAGTALIALLLLVQTGFSLLHARDRAVNELTRQRRSEAKLAATILEGHLHRLSDIAASLSSRVAFSDHVAAGEWDQAIDIMANVSRDLPDVDRIFITDKNGVLRADYPSLVGERGTDFSYRDWYKGVSNGWRIYVSEAYMRTANPRIKVIGVAAPIRDRVTTEIVGVLVVQVPLVNIYQWSSDFDFGQGSTLSFTDRYGNLANDPGGEGTNIADISHDPIVKQVMKGETGTQFSGNLFSEKGEIVAYASVPKYRWGVIIRQPNAVALAAQRESMRGDIAMAAVFFLMYAALALALARIIRQLDVARQMHKFIIESAGDCLAAIDKEWNVTLWNPKAEGVTGWTTEEALGKPLRKVLRLVRRVERTENVLFIADAMLHGKVQYMQDDTVLIRKDGTEVDVADSAAPILDDKGNVMGAVVIFRDVSRERENDRSKSDLISMLTHQLRAPAASIKQYVETGLQTWGGVMDAAQKQHVVKIGAANQKVLDMADALLNAFRTNFEDAPIDPQPTDIAQVADESLNQLRAQLNGRVLHVEKKFDADLPILQLDRQLIALVFDSLLSNAVKYTPDGGSVVLEVHKLNDNIVVKVTDTGIGVPPAEITKIFTRFYRASNVRNIAGVGVDLHMIKTLLERAGCRISIQSSLGNGSTFIVAIPASGMRSVGKR